MQRDRGARMYRVTQGMVQNVYTVKINNMDQKPHQFSIGIEGKPEAITCGTEVL